MKQHRLFAEQRRAAILEELSVRGRIDAKAFADQMSVTHESVRKDLLALEAAGFLRRVHGGAIPIDAMTYEPPVAARTGQLAEKAAIARFALEYLPADGTILLDAGSTTEQLARLLPDDRRLNVYTSAISLAAALSSRSNIVVSTLGGRVRDRTMAEVGPLALRALRSINVDVAFLGTNALSLSRGLTTPDEDEAEVKHEMLRSAARRIFLVDHTKIGRASAHQHARLDDVDVLITDQGVDKADLRALKSAGVSVRIAK